MSRQKPKHTADELRADARLYAAYTRRHERHARFFGMRYADAMFFQLVNPVHQGVNFTWAKFPDMVARLTSVWTGFSDRVWARYGPLLDEDAAEAARARAEEILRLTQIAVWQTPRALPDIEEPS